MGDEEEVGPPSSKLPASVGLDHSGASWRLKLARAQKHLEELEAKVAAYDKRRPYGTRRLLETKQDRKVWRFVLSLKEQADPEIPLILGDVVHNVRSALDHLAVALVPRDKRKSAGFPIENRNLWAKDGRRLKLRRPDDVKARVGFRRRIKAMPREAQAIIRELQPYGRTPPEDHGLFMLNRFENADKHRNLIDTRLGLANVEAYVAIPARGGGTLTSKTFQFPFCYHDAKLIQIDALPERADSKGEMHVYVRGTAMVTAEIGLSRPVDVVASMRLIIRDTMNEVLPLLEPFARA